MKNKPINQCDGCRRKLPRYYDKEHDYYFHTDPYVTYDFIACTKDLYAEDQK